MGAIILAAGSSQDKSIHSSNAHAAIAAKQCIAKAGIDPLDIGLIINVGIYRDRNMVEPAMGVMIQKELGINLDYVKANNQKAAFSLDLMNGGIGALNALQVADAVLQGDVRYVLVVAGEIHPSQVEVKGFPYAVSGSAMLLGKGSSSRSGLQGFAFYSQTEKGPGRKGFLPVASLGGEGRTAMTIESSADYVRDARVLAARECQRYLQSHGLAAKNMNLVSSQLDAEFATALAKELGVARHTDVFKQFGKDPHSAVFGHALHSIEWKPGDEILFVGAGSGITIGCVHYVAA